MVRQIRPRESAARDDLEQDLATSALESVLGSPDSGRAESSNRPRGLKLLAGSSGKNEREDDPRSDDANTEWPLRIDSVWLNRSVRDVCG